MVKLRGLETRKAESWANLRMGTDCEGASVLVSSLWQRHRDQCQGYSLCGFTHTEICISLDIYCVYVLLEKQSVGYFMEVGVHGVAGDSATLEHEGKIGCYWTPEAHPTLGSSLKMIYI